MAVNCKITEAVGHNVELSVQQTRPIGWYISVHNGSNTTFSGRQRTRIGSIGIKLKLKILKDVRSSGSVILYSLLLNVYTAHYLSYCTQSKTNGALAMSAVVVRAFDTTHRTHRSHIDGRTTDNKFQ